MKKLIVATAAVALAGFAVAETPCVIDVKPTASVYVWKFTGKTTVGTPITFSSVGGSLCSLGEKTTTACAIRIPGTLSVQGYVYYCENCCESFASGTGGATLSTFYMTKPFQTRIKDSADITLKVAHIIGKSATQYEAEGTFSFEADSAEVSEKWDLTFAGFGTYNKTKAVVTAVSGNFAGTLKHPYYIGKGVCADADYWTCALTLAGDATADGIAYGNWQVRYNASASTRYRQGYTVTLPAWAR